MDDDRLKVAYAVLGKDDPDAVTLADGMVQSISGELGVKGFTLSRVQRFAWYDLWVNWDATDQQKREVLTAGAALFDALGLDRYASVLRSSEIPVIIAAHRRSYKEGLEAFQRAYVTSGIDPPDLEGLEWGDIMGGQENAAQSAVGLALEHAMDEGRMTPGERGWKTTAKAITAEVVDSAHPEIPGQSWRSVIVTERIENSLRMLEDRSPELQKLMSGIANRLLSPLPPPTDLELHLAPAAWFLEYVGVGAKMTGAGFLPTAMVSDGADRFGWDKGWSDDPPKKESDSRELGALHQLLLDAGAVRHRKGLIARTSVGTKMLEDPEYAWRTIAASLTPQQWLSSVAQVYTLLLLDGESDTEILCDRSRTILTEFGYRFGDEPPGKFDVRSAWRHVSEPLDVLDGYTESGRYPSRRYTLSPFGEATLLERLRLDATGPMRHP